MLGKVKIYLVVLGIAWFALHLPLVFYGTEQLPLHQSYIGDEQAPVNGALHILKDKSLLAFRNRSTVYYGPIFSVLALPGVMADFASKFITGQIGSADDYKNLILFDWGGMVWKLRLLALMFSFVGMVFLAKLLLTKTFNPTQKLLPVYLGTLLLFCNFSYFEYAAFFKHWAFIVPALIIQVYLLVRLVETDYKNKYWIWSLILFIFGFSISYVSALFQIMWLPLLWQWLKEKNTKQLKNFTWYLVSIVLSVIFIVAWHPHAFNRLFGIVGSDIVGTSSAAYTAEKQVTGLSFGYYASIILNNYLSLVLLWLLLVGYLSKSIKLHREWWVWSSGLPAVLFVGIFGFISHHESRYLLPFIILLVVQVALLMALYFGSVRRHQLITITIMGLVIFTMMFNFIHLFKFAAIYGKGPDEKQTIARLLQEQKPGDRILIVDSYLLGHPHTKEAYIDYVAATNKADVNLYKEIIAADFPTNLTPLNTYYVTEVDFTKNYKLITEYDRVVVYYQPRKENNRFDFFDENILRLWYYDDYMPKYFFIK